MKRCVDTVLQGFPSQFEMKCFRTAVKCCISFTIMFQFFHMIFNTSQAGLSLTVLCDGLKIMCKSWNLLGKPPYYYLNVAAIQKFSGVLRILRHFYDFLMTNERLMTRS